MTKINTNLLIVQLQKRKAFIYNEVLVFLLLTTISPDDIKTSMSELEQITVNNQSKITKNIHMSVPNLIGGL